MAARAGPAAESEVGGRPAWQPRASPPLLSPLDGLNLDVNPEAATPFHLQFAICPGKGKLLTQARAWVQKSGGAIDEIGLALGRAVAASPTRLGGFHLPACASENNKEKIQE